MGGYGISNDEEAGDYFNGSDKNCHTVGWVSFIYWFPLVV
jgi:hypothetical protein